MAAASAGSEGSLEGSMKKSNKVRWVKEMSRERLPVPKARVIPDKRAKHWEDLAKSVAGRHGEEI